MHKIEYLEIEPNSNYEKIISKVLEKCFETENLSKDNLLVSIVLTTPDNIRRINKEYRNIDKSTDVLSFPMFEKLEIEEFIKNNLTKIGKYNVKLIKNNISILASYQKKFIEKIIVLKSLRLDNLLSKLINKSREDVKKIIHSKLVMLNYVLILKNHTNLCEGDIITIRGYGKYKIAQIENNKRFKITILKY